MGGITKRAHQEAPVLTMCTRGITALLGGALCFLGMSTAARAQQPDSARSDSSRSHVLRTRDGSVFVGRLLAETPDSVRFETIGGVIAVARANVAELEVVPPSSVRGGVYWSRDPNDTRLFFAPTGRMLKAGDGYFSDTYLLFLNFVGGLTPRFTMGGGFSIIPSDDPTNNIFYITPKIGVLQQPNVNVAVGVLAAFAGFNEDIIDPDDQTFGIAYGVSTFGSPEASFTIGSGIAYTGGGLADRPVFMLGGAARASRRTAFVTENYLFPSADNQGLVSYGVRLMGEKLSVDLAFWNLVGNRTSFLFPGIPYVAIAMKF